MLSLALLMHLRALVGSFATAGAIVGGYLVASALVAPILGRTVDRRGLRRRAGRSPAPSSRRRCC